MYAVRACCLEVSGIAGVQRECNFNKQEETYPDEGTKLWGILEEPELVQPHEEISCS
jgi:hypothetical protein